MWVLGSVLAHHWLGTQNRHRAGDHRDRTGQRPGLNVSGLANGMGRSLHTKEQCSFIVKRLAAFETPREIVIAFAARYRDTACTEQDVMGLDPRIGVVDPDLCALFKTEREAILLDPTAAPFTSQAARMKVLSDQVTAYLNNNQLGEARAVMRQIAEEMGVVAGKGGAKSAATPPSGEPVGIITRTIVDPVVKAA